MRDYFRELDLPPGDLSISFDDYYVYTDSEDKAKFDKIDTDNDGMISEDQLIESIWNDGDSELEKVRAHFNDCNSDGDGFLSRVIEKSMIPPDESKSTEKTDEWWSGLKNKKIILSFLTLNSHSSHCKCSYTSH